MNRFKNILTILFFSLTLVSCEHTKTKQQLGKTASQNQDEKKHNQSTTNPTNKVEDLEVEYIVRSCAYPNWTRTEDTKNNEAVNNYLNLYFYIEPANYSLELIYFDPFRHKLKLTGQFYEREDYIQKIIKMEEPMLKAKVFRYTKIEAIDNPNFKPNSKIETLTLSYNAISCPCAQWSESRFNNFPEKRVNYWLEPANQNIINADTLFNGKDLPVKIKVTGQIISETGFPKNKNLEKVGLDEAGKVFRYTKIEVIRNGQKKRGK